MTVSLGRIVTLGLFVLFSTGVAVCSASDSTSQPFAASGGTTTPVTSRASPYILQQGFLDISGNSSSNASWAQNPTVGWCQSEPINAAGMQSCTAAFFTTRACPSPDQPYIVTYSMKSQLNQNNTSPSVCTINQADWGGFYYVNISSNIVYGNNWPLTGGGIGAPMIGYTTYCYPPGTTVPAYENSNCGPPSPGYNYGSILLYASGYINDTTTASNTTFSIPRACPVGYSPQVIMHLVNPEMRNQYYGQFIAGVGVCVYAASTSGNSTTVNFMKGIDFGNVSATVYNTNMGQQVYVSNSSVAYTNLTTKAVDTSANPGWHIVNGVTVQTNPTWWPTVRSGDPGAPPDIYSYDLYCYPPGISVPVYSNYCNSLSEPFK